MKKYSFLSLVLFLFLLVASSSLEAQTRKKTTTKKAPAKKTATAAKAAAAKKPAAPVFNPKTDPPFLGGNNRWVDSVFKTLSPEERIAQLIMIPVYSNKNQAHVDSISRLINTYKVGGLIFFQGGPVRQAHMTNRYQKESKVPLMVSIDGEWGLAMRLDSTVRFPYQMALGGIENEKLIYDMGAEIARQCRRLGINVNFAPVIDVNNNANNPVIGFRSFGEDKYNVTRKAMAYVKGMQDNQVLANAKHFPGHGDTNVDSHYGLPVIHFSRQRLDSVELYPFRELMKNGLGSLMVAHMNIPVLDNTKDLASTLSKPIVWGLLKQELGYKGLVFTDAMNMQAVAKFYAPGVADVKALLAGNDMLLNTMDVKTTIEEVKKAIVNKEITQAEIDARCKKVLAAKQWMGLDNWKPIETQNLIADLNTPYANYLNNQLTEASLTLLRNKNKILPLQGLDTLKIAALAVGTTQETDFQRGLARYTKVDNFFLPANSTIADLQKLKEQLQGYNLVIAGVHKLQLKAGSSNFGITAEMNLFLKDLIRSKKTIVGVFGNVYSLAKFEDIERADAVVAGYQENDITQDLAAQLVFGGIGAKGKLPVTLSSAFKVGDGLKTETGFRLAYTYPEAVGLRSQDLVGIDSLMAQAIRAKATPGGQVLVAKNGKVIYNKSFGYHTYENKTPVLNTDLYDLASVTKITTSLAAFMRLHGQGRFDVDKTLGEYLPLMKESNKENLRYRDILTHQARLKSWIPFWKEAVKSNGELKSHIFRPDSSDKYPYRVAQNLFIRKDYAEEKIYEEIKDSPLNEKLGYVYSDLSFILAPLVVQKITGQDFETYLKDSLYRPLGASTLTFNPYKQYPLSRIVPTEYDSLFRKQLLHGTVHDEGAAMLGGISGHAGLFGSANDVAKVMQLYLNDGIYAGKRLIANHVVSSFSKCQFCPDNYRALGFDRPSKPGTPNGNAAPSAPAESFGHTGFTGIYTWVDPVNQLVYVFTSNRVYPTRENSKLSQLNTRTNIMQVVYDAMEKAKKKDTPGK
ncbi:serine hydrolase [Nibribacter ruber]|uniref:beta-N-acetylhexosaminidase n=1 Tax=Nibribacter ruber TaxID=2698458 RepID=A0A6P1P0T6_9BACT|nr:glycoside hydrolase family 3 N-terminal domain-containing protein [Nibribacter ruber]QHL88329.1 serine hydrolase [Nibribacter ruber]